MSTNGNGGQAFPCLERGGNGLDLTDGATAWQELPPAPLFNAEVTGRAAIAAKVRVDRLVGRHF